MTICHPSFLKFLYLWMQQMDDAVHTFEQLVHQSLEGNSGEDLCKTVQRCQDRVLKVSPLVQLSKAETGFVCTAPGFLLLLDFLLHFNSVCS